MLLAKLMAASLQAHAMLISVRGQTLKHLRGHVNGVTFQKGLPSAAILVQEIDFQIYELKSKC